MGKIRISTLGTEDEAAAKAKAKVKREEKKKREAAKKSPAEPEVITISEVPETQDTSGVDEALSRSGEKKKASKSRGRAYAEALKLIDRQKLYPVAEAIELIKKATFSKFDATFEAHLNLTEKGLRGSVVLPHGTGKVIRVKIADEALLEQLNTGKIDFDILVTHPSMMAKLAKFAKLLGPKGLMPNPKAGTIGKKPEELAKKFSAGQTQFKTEADFPLLHFVIGKVSFKTSDLEENLLSLTKAIGVDKIRSIYLKSAMSPSARIKI